MKATITIHLTPDEMQALRTAVTSEREKAMANVLKSHPADIDPFLEHPITQKSQFIVIYVVF